MIRKTEKKIISLKFSIKFYGRNNILNTIPLLVKRSFRTIIIENDKLPLQLNCFHERITEWTEL